MSNNAAAEPGRNRWAWLIAGMAFLLGLLLGIAIVVTVEDRSDPAATGVAAPGPTTSSPPGRTTIPADCQRALDRALAALSTTEAAVDALRHLQTARLQQLLDDLQGARGDVDALVARCRQQTRTPG